MYTYTYTHIHMYVLSHIHMYGLKMCAWSGLHWNTSNLYISPIWSMFVVVEIIFDRGDSVLSQDQARDRGSLTYVYTHMYRLISTCRHTRTHTHTCMYIPTSIKIKRGIKVVSTWLQSICEQHRTVHPRAHAHTRAHTHRETPWVYCSIVRTEAHTHWHTHLCTHAHGHGHGHRHGHWHGHGHIHA